MQRKTVLAKGKASVLLRIAGAAVVLCAFAGAAALLFIIKTNEFAFDSAITEHTHAKDPAVKIPESFPVGVFPKKEKIVENPTVDAYFNTYIASNAHPRRETRLSWLQKNILAQLSTFDWFQNLASPISRILIINPGERKEEVAGSVGKILHWDTEEKERFEAIVASSSPQLQEGKFYPGHYVVNKDASPEDVAQIITEQFNANVALRYTPETAAAVPFDDAMTVASLLEREAYDFTDMRYISGIIWNRLFADMNLQIDASLQYAKGSNNASAWWPIVHPSDKYINSPYNTYKNPGLPPSPIASPSPEAILAALNPKQTNCMYYFHDKDGGFHCTATYEDHVALLKQYYGQGK